MCLCNVFRSERVKGILRKDEYSYMAWSVVLSWERVVGRKLGTLGFCLGRAPLRAGSAGTSTSRPGSWQGANAPYLAEECGWRAVTNHTCHWWAKIGVQVLDCGRIRSTREGESHRVTSSWEFGVLTMLETDWQQVSSSCLLPSASTGTDTASIRLPVSS